MKLFIYDKFWDAFLKINKGTQSKVTNFISKFRENSKSAAINLESISTFKDKSLRTARIDQKYRAIIKEVTPSEMYLLIWIDNHDEAMDWAKNKVIDWNQETQAYQVFTLDEEIVEPIQKRTEEKDLFMNLYDTAELLKIGVPEVLMPSILQIKDLVGLEKLEDYLPVDAFENLFYLLDGANIDILIADIKEGQNIEESGSSKNNARSFIEFTDDKIFNEALQGSLHKWKYYLHPSQSAFVYGDFKGPIKLSGGAGTGKTIAALHRLKFLAEHKTGDRPILFTTFTKELSENLKALANELGVDNRNYRVDNIDALAFELAKDFKLLLPTDKVFGLSSVKEPSELWGQIIEETLSAFEPEFLQAEFEEVILVQNVHTQNEYFRSSRIGRGKAISKRQRITIWPLIEAFIAKKKESNLYYKEEIYNLLSSHLKNTNQTVFSHVIVDELQDFSNVELNFIRSLTPESANDLFLVGDPLQNIYDRRINFSKSGINIRGNRSKRLRINYRTTEEIKRLAISIVKDEAYDNFDGEAEDKSGYMSLFHGVNPEYHTYRTKDEELEAVTKDIEKLIFEGYHYSEIVISARTRQAVNDFRNYLHKENIPYTTKHFLNKKIEGVRLTTFHGMKGLEFKQVFLVDVNDRTLPRQPHNFNSLTSEEQSRIIKAEKALFYVASSRAIQRLMISGIGQKSTSVFINS